MGIGQGMEMTEVQHSNLYPEIEFWAAVLSGGREPMVSDTDLELAVTCARHCLTHSVPPRVSCLAYYVYGKAILLRRRQYPEWQRWVPYAAIFALENAAATRDPALRRLCVSLFEDYVHYMKEEIPT